MSLTNQLTELKKEYRKQCGVAKSCNDAKAALAFDPSATSMGQVEYFTSAGENANEAKDKLEKIQRKLFSVQRKIAKDINSTSKTIGNYQTTLSNNDVLLKKYEKQIKNKMSVVATRDRMLQLSQERNVYKKKVINVLFSIIIALLVAIISAYTVFGKKMSK